MVGKEPLKAINITHKNIPITVFKLFNGLECSGGSVLVADCLDPLRDDLPGLLVGLHGDVVLPVQLRVNLQYRG